MIFNHIKKLKADGKKIGITFSQFDMLHAGHIAMLAEAKNHCDYLIAALQTDASIDRPDTKNPPIQSIVERQIQLATIGDVTNHGRSLINTNTRAGSNDGATAIIGDVAINECVVKGLDTMTRTTCVS